MCTIALAINAHPEYKLIVISNRDEFYDRPTKEAHLWPPANQIIGGKDLKEGGMWLGINKLNRFAALTNYREPQALTQERPSRGSIVLNYLNEETNIIHYLEKLEKNAHIYHGFNLLAGTFDTIYYYSNRYNKTIKLSTGIHAVSNGLLNNQWFKVQKVKNDLTSLISTNTFSIENALNILYSNTQAPDNLLPDTGFGFEKEKLLSSVFIDSPGYGTTISTIIYVTNNNKINFYEYTHKPKSKYVAFEQ